MKEGQNDRWGQYGKKLVFPFVLTVVYMIWVKPMGATDQRFICGIVYYLALFVYCLILGEVKALFQEVKGRIREWYFIRRILITFCLSVLFSFGYAYLSRFLKVGEFLTVPADYQEYVYIIAVFSVLIRAIVEAIVYQKWMISFKSMAALEMTVIFSLVVQCVIQAVGLKSGLMTFFSMIPPIIMYVKTKDLGASYLTMVLFRIFLCLVFLRDYIWSLFV